MKTVCSYSPWLLAILVAVVGCSGTEDTGKGVVRFTDGEVVESGSVEFRSLASGDRYAGKIDSSGRFKLVDKDGRVGIPDGDYEVVVVQIVLTEDLAADMHSHGRSVPRRYADYYTSDLRVTTKAESPLSIELVLSTE